MSKKPPAAQTNEIPASKPTDKKRIRAKSEYVIERRVTSADIDGTDRFAWEPFPVLDKDVFKDTAAALAYIKSGVESKDSSQTPVISPGEYRIIVVKWQKTVKQVQQTTVQFE